MKFAKLFRALPLARRYRSLLQSQYWPTETLHQHQLRLLKELLTEAQHVPFFSQLLEQARTNPHEWQSPAQIAELPVTTKRMLMAAPVEERIQPGLRSDQLVSRFTSGSTCEPFTALFTAYEKDMRVTNELRMFAAHGYGLSDSMLSFRRMTDISTGRSSFLGMCPRFYGDYTSSAEQQFEQLRQCSPSIMKAHANTLVRMANLITPGYQPPSSLRLLVSCAEFLTPQARGHIERQFCVPVADQYGTCEFGSLPGNVRNATACM